MILDENKNPIKEDGFIMENIKKVPGMIKDLILPGSPGFTSKPKIQTPPLGNTPMPKLMANVTQKNPITNLTRNEEALLSPTEKVIAGRT